MNNDSGKYVDETMNAGPDASNNSEKKRRFGKKTKVFLIILLVLLLGIGFLCVRYWHIIKIIANKENIDAYVNSKKYTTEEIKGQMEENKIKMEKIAEESPLIQIRGELTEEEVEALKNGEITQEEAKSLVKGELTLEEIRENKAAGETQQDSEPTKEETSNKKTETEEKKPASSKESSKTSTDKKASDTSSSKSTSGDKASKPSADNKDTTSGKPSSSSKPAEPEDKVSEIVSELYVIQADFMNRLEAVGNQAYADYKATSYDRSQVMPIVDSYTATVGAMEAECDGKVNGLLKELDAELKKNGEDRSMVKEIRNYYYKEKSLKKSYYLDQLNNEDFK